MRYAAIAVKNSEFPREPRALRKKKVCLPCAKLCLYNDRRIRETEKRSEWLALAHID